MAGTTYITPVAAGDFLTAEVTAERLGFRIETVWNPSPSVQHRTDPYPVPKRLEMGLFGTEESGAKFSPPPYAVVVEGGGKQTLVAVAAEAGWHSWNQVQFATTAAAVSVSIDLEGHTVPAEAAAHVTVNLLSGEPGETRLALLTRGMRCLYPRAFAYAAPAAVPAWWRRPIYCGWGDQVTVSMWLEGVGPEPRALAYCVQGLYERWIRRLEDAQVPVGTIIIDAGWSPAGVYEPDTERWPDLKGFIARQHAAGRRVLLWLATWLWDGLPDEWCIFADGVKLTADPTNPAYMGAVRDRVRRLLAPDGYDADGFKIDQLAYSPSERQPRGGPRFGLTQHYPAPREKMRPVGPGWGCELLWRLQREIYTAAKAAKPDALVTSSTVHPYFHDTLDMVRLHDMGYVAPDIFAAMQARADLRAATMPGKLVDTDDWIHSDYALWQSYTAGSGIIGVPCLFYAERFMLDWAKEPATKRVPLADLRRIARAWQRAG